MVNESTIRTYAQKNTSPQMPIEAKYVNAFVNSILNSTSVQTAYNILAEEMQNGESFLIFNSFWETAAEINMEPYRSIVAYAMVKKDFRLFELISASLFTGTVSEYHGEDLYTEVVENTDIPANMYTDMGLYTDMSPGSIFIGFTNIYCDNPLPDGTGSEFQTYEQMMAGYEIFKKLITMTKPARVGVFVFFEPYCFIGGNNTELRTCGIDTDNPDFISPFGTDGNGSYATIMGMSDNDLMNCYRIVSMFDDNNPINIESERTVTEIARTEHDDDPVEVKRYLMFTYKLRCVPQEGASSIWGNILILSNLLGISNLNNIVFTPDNAHKQNLNNHYFIRLDVKFPRPD